MCALPTLIQSLNATSKRATPPRWRQRKRRRKCILRHRLDPLRERTRFPLQSKKNTPFLALKKRYPTTTKISPRPKRRSKTVSHTIVGQLGDVEKRQKVEIEYWNIHRMIIYWNNPQWSFLDSFYKIIPRFFSLNCLFILERYGIAVGP